MSITLKSNLVSYKVSRLTKQRATYLPFTYMLSIICNRFIFTNLNKYQAGQNQNKPFYLYIPVVTLII